MSQDEVTGRTPAAERVIYRVVVNEEEQYSIWPFDRELPSGWRDTGKSGDRQACLDYVREIWTDMRPLSVRRWMDGAAGSADA